jgi:hypothetical protein
MTLPRIRLCDSDREKYGGPEWVELKATELMDEDTGIIELIEEAWDLTPVEFLRGINRNSTRALRAMIWVARRKAGCLDDARTFRPKTQSWSGVTYEALPAEEKLAADADPPANRADRRAARKAPGKKKATAGSRTSSTSTTLPSSAG